MEMLCRCDTPCLLTRPLKGFVAQKLRGEAYCGGEFHLLPCVRLRATGLWCLTAPASCLLTLLLTAGGGRKANENRNAQLYWNMLSTNHAARRLRAAKRLCLANQHTTAAAMAILHTRSGRLKMLVTM